MYQICIDIRHISASRKRKIITQYIYDLIQSINIHKILYFVIRKTKRQNVKMRMKQQCVHRP